LSPQRNASPPRLKLCTWNLHLGLELPAILRSIDAEEDFRNLDLLALQESSVHGDSEDAAVIAARLGPDFRHLQVETHVLSGRVQANALVWNSSRVRILEKQVLLLPKREDHPLSRTERALLSITRLQQRMALFFDCWIAGQAIRLYVAHLDVLGYQHKLQQFGRILADLEEREPADITILAGDLNTFRMATRPRWTRLRSAAETAGFEDLTTDIKWTHRPRTPSRQKLDAIFVRCDRSLLYESWSVDLPGSDHIPVFAEILGWGD
jgi:endonuclease/exonuclease/phosphatase family metal-dependent hydrolase